MLEMETCFGVLCDRHMLTRLKEKFCKSVIRPSITYEGESWPIRKQQMQNMSIAKMRKLRWMYSKTRQDRIWEHLGVASISNKLRELFKIVWTCLTQANNDANEEKFFYEG